MSASLVIGGSAMVTAMTVAPAAAQEEGRQFGAKAGAIVNEALQFINSNQHSAAIGKLNEAIAIPELNAYERSTVYQMMGASYYETNNYGQAISSFENAINAGGLLPNESSALRVNIAQLLIANGSYAQGAQMLENYLNRGGQQKPQYTEMLVQAWVQSDNYSKALPWAEKWFNSASPKERKHFDLLNFLYNNLRMPGKQADIVRQMINRWPEDKTLWDAWASMLANGGREQEAFEVTKMLYLGGALNSEADLMKVVQYYSFYDMPFQAAQILERELNAGRISQRFLKKLRRLLDRVSSMRTSAKRSIMKGSVSRLNRLSIARFPKVLMRVKLTCLSVLAAMRILKKKPALYVKAQRKLIVKTQLKTKSARRRLKPLTACRFRHVKAKMPKNGYHSFAPKLMLLSAAVNSKRASRKSFASKISKWLMTPRYLKAHSSSMIQSVCSIKRAMTPFTA